MRILGAARVSTKKQARDERKSLPYQQKVIQEYADRLGAELVDTLVFAESGHKSTWRKELDGIKDAAKRLQADVVVTSELDRLARRQHWQGQFVEDLDKAGIRYRAILDDLDTGREGDRVKLLALGMVSEIFVMGLRRKVRAGMEMRAEQGKHNARIPYGFLRGEDGNRVIDPLRAPWAAKAFEMRAEGHGIPAITRHLRDNGAPLPAGSTVWFEYTVRYILANPAYAGTLSWGGIIRGPRKGQGKAVLIENAGPAIIQPALWDQVQRINQARHRARSRAESPHLLAGLVYSHCGCGMHAERAGWTRADGLRPRLYRSQCHKWRGEGHRPNRISADWLEHRILAALDAWTQGGGPPAGFRARVQQRAPVDAGAYDRQITENRARLSRLEDMLMDNKITEGRYDLRRAELEAEHARLLAAREAAIAEEPALDQAALAALAADMRQVYAALRGMPPQEGLQRWKAFLQQFIARIEIGPPATSRRPEDRTIQVLFRLGGGSGI